MCTTPIAGAQGKRGLDFAGLPLPALVIYVIAWQVTDVRLDRLVTRFGNALKIWNDLIHPDLFTRDAAGKLIPSENFGYIFGTVRAQARARISWCAWAWCSPARPCPRYEAGKIVETIALGLMSTIFSTILAVPVSFLAARNIMSRIPGGMVIYYVMRTFSTSCARSTR